MSGYRLSVLVSLSVVLGSIATGPCTLTLNLFTYVARTL